MTQRDFRWDFLLEKYKRRDFRRDFLLEEYKQRDFRRGFLLEKYKHRDFQRILKGVKIQYKLPPLPPLWVFMTPSLNMETEIFLSVDIIM